MLPTRIRKLAACARAISPRVTEMAKGQMRSNKETKKPKKEKPKTIAAAASVKVGQKAK